MIKVRINYNDGTSKVIAIEFKTIYIKTIKRNFILNTDNIPQIIPFDEFRIVNYSNEVEPIDYIEIYKCSRCQLEITQEEYERDMSLCSNCEQEVDREEE